MTTVCKEITFDAAHMLSGYEGKCRNLHGHTYRLVVEASGEPDDSGMVEDFFNLKRHLEEKVAAALDHAYLYDARSAEECELAHFLQARGKRVVGLPFRTTSENLARHIYGLLSEELNVSAVRLWETPTSCAVFTA